MDFVEHGLVFGRLYMAVTQCARDRPGHIVTVRIVSHVKYYICIYFHGAPLFAGLEIELCNEFSFVSSSVGEHTVSGW